jgi:FkbM family methyltransferase
MLSRIIKNSLSHSPRVFDLVKAIGRRCGKSSGIYSGLKSQIDSMGAFTFLQVGANDGLTNDPYREFMIRGQACGVAAEPVPEYFARLSSNYRGYKGVECLNAAIAYGATSTSFFTFTPKYLDSLGGALELAGLAGFSREKLELVLPPEVSPSECIQEISVKTCTVEQILEERRLGGFDCIFMDCEGHELNILQGMDFAKVKPRLIAYEHTHYPEGLSPLDELLQSKGFKIQKYEFDAVAIRVA